MATIWANFLSGKRFGVHGVNAKWDGWRLKTAIAAASGTLAHHFDVIHDNRVVVLDRNLADQNIEGDVHCVIRLGRRRRILVRLVGPGNKPLASPGLVNPCTVTIPWDAPDIAFALGQGILEMTGIYPARQRFAVDGTNAPPVLGRKRDHSLEATFQILAEEA